MQVVYGARGEPLKKLWSSSQPYGVFGEKIGVVVGTKVYPVLTADDVTLYETVGTTTRVTTKEWIVEIGKDKEVLYDYTKFVFVFLWGTTKDELTGVNTVGFFVPKDKLYFRVEERHDTVARNGKVIDREVEVASSSNPNKRWKVLVYKDGTRSCNCPAWIYQNGVTRGCKHTKKVK